MGITLAEVTRQIRKGRGIGESFREASLFPAFVARMVTVGETTGALDKSLLYVCEHFRKEADRSIARFEQMVGPALTLIVGFFLVWVIAAVLGPIYGSLEQMGLRG